MSRKGYSANASNNRLTDFGGREIRGIYAIIVDDPHILDPTARRPCFDLDCAAFDIGGVQLRKGQKVKGQVMFLE